MKYKGMIFDLDGTLADTLHSIAISGNQVLEQCKMKALPEENYKYYAGEGVATLIKKTLTAAGDTQLLYYEKAFEIYSEIFKKDCTNGVKVFDGIKNTLDDIKSKGIKLGVVTNKPHDIAILVVEFLFGKGYFDMIIGQQERFNKKPDPASVLYTANYFGVLPEECIYVGDTDVDMKTGKSANMYTVGVLWGFRTKEELEEHKADCIIEWPKDLINLLA